MSLNLELISSFPYCMTISARIKQRYCRRGRWSERQRICDILSVSCGSFDICCAAVAFQTQSIPGVTLLSASISAKCQQQIRLISRLINESPIILVAAVWSFVMMHSKRCCLHGAALTIRSLISRVG